jgi:autotransporter-associated beta strand protein
VTQAGTGTTVLTGTNTYGGTTAVNAGTLQIGAGGTTGTLGAGAVTNNGTLVFNRADALTVTNTIGGTGSLVQVGGGTTTLTGTNTYSGPTTVTGGALRIGADNNLGTGGELALNGGTLETTASFALNRGVSLGASGGTFDVDAGTTLTYGGVVAGAGALAKADAGTLTLTGNNTYAGATTINGGTLRVGNKGTTGTLGAGAVTDNANLVFDRAGSTSLAALAAGGITGTGNVSVLAGGNLDVDRTIALTGAGSTILLEAGRDQPAGTAAGGDVTLTSSIGTSATGTVTIFSGNATTAAYEAKIGGATGPTRYKTYNASAADTGGAVAGTRNYVYRQGAGTLSVAGLTATKIYDGLVDATVALSTGNAAVAASADGDLLAYRDLTQASATFDSAHAGSRTVTATFTAPTDIHYAAGGANWSVARFSGGTVTGTGTITPRPITTSIDGKGKTYDGLTGTMSTLGAPSGFVGGDSASGIAGILLAFDNPNAGTRNIVASGKGSLADFKGKASGNGSGVGAHNEVAGLAGDYTVATPASASAVIAPAALTVRANDDAKLLTQADPAGYNGVHVDGFVHGESVADLGGALTITRSNADTNAAGNYAGVLVPGGYTSSNYAITYANGDFRILPAQQLLVRVQNVQNNYGTSAAYAVTSAQYLDADGKTVRTLTQTAHDGNTFTYSDGMGGGVTFTVAPQGVVRSGAGQLAVGNYALAGTGANVVGANFTATHYVGNQSVNRIGLTPQVSGVTKVYDGTTAATGVKIGLGGLLAGDTVGADAAGAFSSRNAGTNRSYTINGMTLHGADAGNYYLAAASLSGNDGTITPRPITVAAVPDTKVYDGTHGAAATPVVTGSLAAGDSFASLSQAFTSANVGMNVTLAPQAQIDDGNGGANYVLTLVDNTAGVIRTGVDVNQVGVPHVEATLNRDANQRQPVRTMRCDQGVYRDACTAASDSVYRIVARGLKLPPGLALP